MCFFLFTKAIILFLFKEKKSSSNLNVCKRVFTLKVMHFRSDKYFLWVTHTAKKMLFLTYLFGISWHDYCCWLFFCKAVAFAFRPAKHEIPFSLCCVTLAWLLLVPLRKVQPPLRIHEFLFLCLLSFPSRVSGIL